MCVCLCLLAGSTAFDVAAYEVGETRPPEFSSDQLASFQEARMSGGGMIMVVGDNGLMKVKIIRDINLALKCEDSSVILPVQEVGMEGWGNLSGHGLEGSEDDGIRDRGSRQLG